jgi:hypothetical protein
MSLHNLAKEIQKKGRGDDRMLVHMTPKEVEGLQAIARAHGGSLTINPDTGLVEAGFLKNLLPMVIGAGITAATGGAAAPWMLGLGYGAFETARTGDIGKGLMAGLGAYGGAGLASGLATAGSSSLATPEAVAGQLGVEGAQTGANSQAAMLAEQNAGFGTQGLESIRSAAATAQPTAIPQFDGSTLVGTQSMGAQAPLPTYGQQLQAGVKGLGTEAGRSAVYNALPTGTLPGLAAPLAAGAMEPKNNVPAEEEYKRKYPELSLAENFRGYSPARPNPYYRPTGLGYTGYAEGGLTQMAPGGLAALQGARDGYGALETMDGNIPQFEAGGRPEDKRKKKATYTGGAKIASMDPMEAGLAELNNARAMAQMGGGNFALPRQSVQELGVINAAQGRYLKGDGDGMSDSIPATINGKQPARLADGEFVVPADVVSHLGNGSSDAGAKKLYAMMDKVRVARTGKKQQAKAVKSDKYMPA